MFNIMFIFPALILTTFTSLNALASAPQAAKLFEQAKGSPLSFDGVAKELIQDKAYYASIPFVKDYLLAVSQSKRTSTIDPIIDKLIREVGVKQFELLPDSILMASNSPLLRYIRAKKQFSLGKFSQTLEILQTGIPADHVIKPFAVLVEASSLSMLGRHDEAMRSYNYCADLSSRNFNSSMTKNERKQLEINRDYCIIGKSRTQFAQKKYSEAELSYLDLPKDSYVWPEIIFEEAWNSFYLKNYNRTLGKLVTYKAPVFDHVFNPEISVLRALSYMELCLWGDAKKEVDEFYDQYGTQTQELKVLLSKQGHDYKYYYQIAREREKGMTRETELVNRLLYEIRFDPTYNELLDSFIKGKNEVVYLQKMNLGKFKSVVLKNVRDALILQRDLIGRYVRKSLVTRYGQLQDTFEGMSYIKLEVLSRKKAQLYTGGQTRERGDIKYLARNDKQYFWTFNGEFWADELADYVFALPSECN